MTFGRNVRHGRVVGLQLKSTAKTHRIGREPNQLLAKPVVVQRHGHGPVFGKLLKQPIDFAFIFTFQ